MAQGSTCLPCLQEQNDPESHFQETSVESFLQQHSDQETMSTTTLRYGLLILLKHPEMTGFQARAPRMRGLGFGNG